VGKEERSRKVEAKREENKITEEKKFVVCKSLHR
jgi:hypothetical protein